MTTPDPAFDDLRAIAAAYRGERIEGRGDLDGYRAALAVYLDRHPADTTARQRVAEMIFAASELTGAWLYGK